MKVNKIELKKGQCVRIKPTGQEHNDRVFTVQKDFEWMEQLEAYKLQNAPIDWDNIDEPYEHFLQWLSNIDLVHVHSPGLSITLFPCLSHDTMADFARSEGGWAESHDQFNGIFLHTTKEK